MRQHLSFANVISCLALFVALGGASYAAVSLPKNSVGSAQIRKNAVRTGEIARNAVRTGKLAPESVRAGKIAKNAIVTNRLRDNSVSGAKVDEATLGTVPTAARADTATAADKATQADRATAADIATRAEDAESLVGLTPDAFVQGGGKSAAGRAILALGDGGEQHVVDVPGYGEVVGGCGSGGGVVGFKNESGGDLRVLGVAGTEAAAETVADGAASADFPSGAGSAGLTTMQIGSTDFADQALLTVIATREATSGGKCGVQAWTVTR